jgi:hypothetical protein
VRKKDEWEENKEFSNPLFDGTALNSEDKFPVKDFVSEYTVPSSAPTGEAGNMER